MSELTLREAQDIYFSAAGLVPCLAPEFAQPFQPNSSLTERTDADDGWHFRNINDWLATVYDDGSIITMVNHEEAADGVEVWQERVRGTLAEDTLDDARR